MTHEAILYQISIIYPNKLMLSKKEVAQITGRSISSIDRDIKNGTGIKYKRTRDRGRVLFPISEVAKWMDDLVVTE